MSVLGLQSHRRPMCSGDTCSKQDVNMISSRLLLPDPPLLRNIYLEKLFLWFEISLVPENPCDLSVYNRSLFHLLVPYPCILQVTT